MAYFLVSLSWKDWGKRRRSLARSPEGLNIVSRKIKAYDLLVIGTGSAMNIVEPMLNLNPGMKIAIIDKDDPGGTCLTRGCIPSKMLVYPAELVRVIETASKLGVQAEIKKIDFRKVMERMRTSTALDVAEIRRNLTHHPDLDYYPEAAEFVAPYTLEVGGEILEARMIILGTGSKPLIPPAKGLEEAGYLTSDTVLKLGNLPESIAIVGGGYIAAEYGHFFSAMGSRVIIIGRNPQFLPGEEPEISSLVKEEMSRHMTLLTNREVLEVKNSGGEKRIVTREREQGKEMEIIAAEILVAAGRGPNTDILHPEKSNIKVDGKGWILVNEYLETSHPQIYALGDANGKYLFKHKANYESLILYRNLVLKQKAKTRYEAIPHAVFCYPEVASVGLGEKEALQRYGAENILLGLAKYENTGKGLAMGVKGYFVKVIVEKGTGRILGGHIVGPQASILLQEVITQMYTQERTADPIANGMHIHPALSEVVESAFQSLVSPAHYHHVLEGISG